MTLPPITVALFTYAPDLAHARHQYALDTLRGALEHLRYDGELRWHIADDGSGPDHATSLADLVLHVMPPMRLTWSDSARRGYGASWNAMTGVVHQEDQDLVLCLEDDWLLVRRLDLTPLASAIVATQDADDRDVIRCIRLGYLGWTQPLFGRLIRPIAGQTFLRLESGSPEHHVFSAGPRLETVAFERSLGLWPEHVVAGIAEMDVAGRPQSRQGVVWPLDQGINAALDNPSTFVHIGGVSVKDEAPV